ncbi:MAG: Undecaprenyl-phosphate mannosyltransferase [Phycisphaerae bacterium]|nr:Undecaprenyl-phosphate mannosyltransferase [Phycisphaerae bacterium]
MRWLLAIPVYNERRHIRQVLQKVRPYGLDILVVDDGSTDGTTELIHRERGIRSIVHPENRGYGQALISSFEYAQSRGYEWLITMDCDEQHEPSHIPDFMTAARQGLDDLISGSRYLGMFAGDDIPPPDRRQINTLITRLLNELLGLQLTDGFCGFKAYRVEALRRLQIDIPGYAMPLQFWVQAVRRELRIREIPIRLIYNDPTRHFGGLLDDPLQRLAHYLEVLTAELLKEQVIGHPAELQKLLQTHSPCMISPQYQHLWNPAESCSSPIPASGWH